MSNINYKKITNAVFDNLCDVMIFSTAFLVCTLGKTKGSRAINQAFDEANWILENKLNHETVRRAFQKLKNNHLIKEVKYGGKSRLVLTEKGTERLKNIIPQYQKNREWDGKIRIITYDIPEKQKRKRDLLREAIRRLGGGMVAESVWINPYDIRGLIEDFVEEHNINGIILVSNMGKDGALGKKPLGEIITEVYNLEKINERYVDFIKSCDTGKYIRCDLLTKYLSILKDDPQLPFSLLPKWWKGGEAFRRYSKLRA